MQKLYATTLRHDRNRCTPGRHASLSAQSTTSEPPAVSATKILWAPILVVILIVVTTTWAATQWTAWRLGFQPQLGEAWIRVAGVPLYPPPAFFLWWFRFGARIPKIFAEGAVIAASGGLAAVVTAIAMSLLRAKEAKAITTYGSARWASHCKVSAISAGQMRHAERSLSSTISSSRAL